MVLKKRLFQKMTNPSTRGNESYELNNNQASFLTNPLLAVAIRSGLVKLLCFAQKDEERQQQQILSFH